HRPRRTSFPSCRARWAREHGVRCGGRWSGAPSRTTPGAESIPGAEPRLDRAALCGPVRDASDVMTDVRVAEVPEQADRLLSERSGGATAVDRDLPRRVQNLQRAGLDLRERKAQGSGDMARRVGLPRENVHDHERGVLQAAADLLAGD